jgi:hypothetical protein
MKLTIINHKKNDYHPNGNSNGRHSSIQTKGLEGAHIDTNIVDLDLGIIDELIKMSMLYFNIDICILCSRVLFYKFFYLFRNNMEFKLKEAFHAGKKLIRFTRKRF